MSSLRGDPKNGPKLSRSREFLRHSRLVTWILTVALSLTINFGTYEDIKDVKLLGGEQPKVRLFEKPNLWSDSNNFTELQIHDIPLINFFSSERLLQQSKR